jgi:2-oxoglutarate dehydrogenase complex dehydrogenase (E1) component-like enzyme
LNVHRERVETPEPFSFSPEQKFHLLDRLTWATLFERFLAMKYQNTKRFGLDGSVAHTHPVLVLALVAALVAAAGGAT